MNKVTQIPQNQSYNQGHRHNPSVHQVAISQKSVKSSILSLPIQPKLKMGTVNDPWEQQADTMANMVMRMPGNGLVQRKCQSCEEEDHVQRATLTNFIQKKGAPQEIQVSQNVSQKIADSRGKGYDMSRATQGFMESRFRHDFSQVNIHTGREAENLSTELGAKAFTVGNDIYFNQGQYNPNSNEGKHLLAHELTHTIQQKQQPALPIQRTSDATDLNLYLSDAMLEQSARRLHNAMAGLGTDEETIYSVLSGRDQHQANRISDTYRALFNRDLLADLQDELTEGEMRQLALFSPRPDPSVEYHSQRFHLVATQLRAAMEGLGTNEASIFAALTGRLPHEIGAIRSAYHSLTGRSLTDDLNEELSGNDLTEATRLLDQGVLAPEDELYLAMRGMGTDEETLFRVLGQISGDHAAIVQMELDYRNKYGDLIAHLRSDLSSEEYLMAMTTLQAAIPDAAFEDCDTALIAQIRPQIATGIQKVDRAIGILTNGWTAMSAHQKRIFNRYFDPAGSGSVDQAFIDAVLANYRRIRREYTDDLTFECDTGAGMCSVPNRYGWTVFGNIHICPYFFTMSARKQARGILHELTHNALMAADRSYEHNSGFSNLTPRGNMGNQIPIIGPLIRVIARDDTLNNPDSYSHFAFHI